MSFSIGRCGLTPTIVGDHATYRRRGPNEFELGGWLVGSNVANVKVLTQQLLGHVNNPWEPEVPFIWSNDTTQTGYVRVLDADVENVLGSSPPDGASVRFSARCEKVRAGVDPLFESNIQSALRTNGHSIIASGIRAWHGMPSTYSRYDNAGLGDTYETRQGPGGTARLWVPSTGGTSYYESAYPVWGIPPANYYDMAATLTVGGNVVVGREFVPDKTSWELSNGFVKIGAGNTSTHMLKVTMPINATRGTWGTSREIEVGFDTAGTWTSHNLTQVRSGPFVLRNDPACVVIRLNCMFAPALGAQSTMYNVDIGLRRGSAFFEIVISSDNSRRWGLRTNTASTSLTEGLYDTTADADGNKLACVVTPADGTHLASGRVYPSSATTKLGIGILCSVGDPGSGCDEIVNMIGQYFAAQSEKVLAVLP